MKRITGAVRGKDDHGMERRAMRIGTGIMTHGRILFLLLATAFPWKAVAAEAPLPVSGYVEAAFANNPSLDAMRERIRMKENAATRAGALDDPKLRVGVNSVPVRSLDFREEEMTTKEIGRMREMLINLENREQVLSVRLNALAALPADRPVPPLEDLPEISLPYGQEDLAGMYEAARPARKAAQARVRRGDSSIRMANLAGKPEFDVSFSYMQRDAMPDGTKRSDMFSSMVMMTLPIWRKEKIEPGIREMEAEKRMAERELANLNLETSNFIGRSLATMASRRRGGRGEGGGEPKGEGPPRGGGGQGT